MYNVLSYKAHNFCSAIFVFLFSEHFLHFLLKHVNSYMNIIVLTSGKSHSMTYENVLCDSM